MGNICGKKEDHSFAHSKQLVDKEGEKKLTKKTSDNESAKWERKSNEYSKLEAKSPVQIKFMDVDEKDEAEVTHALQKKATFTKVPNMKDFKKLKAVDDICEIYEFK